MVRPKGGSAGGWAHVGIETGLTAADTVCQAEGEAAFGPGAAFVALLSTTAVDAIDRVTAAGPYVRPDGFVVAETPDDFFLQWRPTFPPIQTATGQYVAHQVWSGTSHLGLADGDRCNDWQAGDDAFKGRVASTASRFVWSITTYDCNSTLPLICVE